MNFRKAVALITMSRIAYFYFHADLRGLPYETLVSFLCSCVTMALCALAWRVIVGKDEW